MKAFLITFLIILSFSASEAKIIAHEYELSVDSTANGGCLNFNPVLVTYDSEQNSLEFGHRMSDGTYFSFSDYAFYDLNKGPIESQYNEFPSWKENTFVQSPDKDTLESKETVRGTSKDGQLLRKVSISFQGETMSLEDSSVSSTGSCSYEKKYSARYKCSLENRDDYAVEIDTRSERAAFFDNDMWTVLTMHKPINSTSATEIYSGTDTNGEKLSVELDNDDGVHLEGDFNGRVFIESENQTINMDCQTVFDPSETFVFFSNFK